MIYRRWYGFPIQKPQSPFSELERMRREWDNLLGQLAGSPQTGRHVGVFPAINLSENSDNYMVRAELPGIKAEDLSIEATGNNLSISGERKISQESGQVRYHRRERESGNFSRIIALPGDIDTDKIDASLTNGILTVAIPKAEVAKPKQISVK